MAGIVAPSSLPAALWADGATSWSHCATLASSPFVIDDAERVDAVHSRAVERDLRLAGDLRHLKLDVRDLKNVAFAWHDEHRADRTNLQERVERLERHFGIERA